MDEVRIGSKRIPFPVCAGRCGALVVSYLLPVDMDEVDEPLAYTHTNVYYILNSIKMIFFFLLLIIFFISLHNIWSLEVAGRCRISNGYLKGSLSGIMIVFMYKMV